MSMIKLLAHAAQVAATILADAGDMPDVTTATADYSHSRDTCCVDIQLSQTGDDATSWAQLGVWAAHLGGTTQISEPFGGSRPRRKIEAVATVDGLTVSVWDLVAVDFAPDGSVAA